MTLNFRSIISFFFLALVLIMSSGLTIYSRSCEEGCADVISFFEKGDCCKKEKVKKANCCHKEQHDHGEDGDCCDTEAFYLDADFYGSFHKVESEVIALEVTKFVYLEFGLVYQMEKYQFSDLPPPDLPESGRTIILKKNSFLI